MHRRTYACDEGVCVRCAQEAEIDDTEDDDADECDCSEYEHIDPLTGCATCGRCGARRYLSSEQMKEIERLQAEYDEAMERDNT